MARYCTTISGSSGYLINTESLDQILHCHCWKFWSYDTDITSILSTVNNYSIQIIIEKFSYRLDIVSNQFLEIGSSVDQLLDCLGFTYPPFLP